MTSRRPVSVFVSSADRDTPFVVKLLDDLMPWLNASSHFAYTVWDYRSCLVSGLSFEEQILTALAKADLVLGLVSPAWLASWYSMNKELPVALAQNKLIPVLLEQMPLSDKAPHALDLKGMGSLQFGIYRNSQRTPKGYVDLKATADRRAYACWLSEIIAARIQAG